MFCDPTNCVSYCVTIARRLKNLTMELSSHLTEDGGAKTGGGYGNETPQRDRDDASVGAGGENGAEEAAGEADAKGGEPTAVPGTDTKFAGRWLHRCVEL
jgi:hypothetical protein